MSRTFTKREERNAASLRLFAKLTRYGVTMETREWTGGWSSKGNVRLDIVLKLHGVGCLITIGGERVGEGFMASWYMRDDLGRRFAPGFARGSDINPHHRQKATTITKTFDDLVEPVVEGFAQIADGTAFVAAPDLAKAS